MEPANAAGHLFITAQRMARDKYCVNEAERLFKRAIELDPGNADLYFHYGQLLNRDQRCVEAVEMFSQCVILNRSHQAAWMCLSALFFNQQLYRRAQHACQQALRCDLTAEQQILIRSCLREATEKLRV